MLASVVICTYNRCDLLEASLRSLIAQDLPADAFEVVVVDNNSADDTWAKVAALASDSPVAITYVLERKQGLSNARNSGIGACRGEIVVFADDDIEAEPQWLRELVKVFEAPEVAGAGGPIRPMWGMPRPQWLTSEWEGFLTVSEFEQARERGYFSYPDYPWGANIAFRRTVFEKVGMFPTDLGRIGNSLLSNEELNICKKVEAAGFRIAFAPGAVIHHKIPAERMRKTWMMHRSYWQGRSDAILDAGTAPFSFRRLRDFARQVFWHHVNEPATDFSTVCITRNLMGYLDQLIISQQTPSISHFRKLRALRTFLGSFTKLTAKVLEEKKKDAADREEYVAQLRQWLADREQDVHDRDGWLADRAASIAQYQQWQTDLERSVRDRDRWLAARDASIAEYKQWLADLEQSVRDRDQWLADRDTSIAQYKQWLGNLEQSVRDRDQWLEERDASIAQYKQWLADREKDIHDRDEWLARRDASIAEHQKWLADREQDVRDRDQWLAQRDTALTASQQKVAEQAALIADQARRLAESEKAIHDLDQQVADRDTLLAAQTRRLAESEEEILQREQLVAERDALIDAQTQWLAESEKKISSLDQVMAAHEALISEQKKLLTEREREVRELDQMLVRNEARLAKKKQRLADREMEVAEHERQIRDLYLLIQKKDEQISELKRSWSWRITAPLRGVASILKK